MKEKYKTRITSHRSRRKGSALILTVVLTTLLATIGVLFVLLSRIDKMAASAMSENKQLNFAIDTVVAKISQELVLDVPGVAGQEYHDYPGPADSWLASLEPDNRMWQQISDVTGYLGNKGWPAQKILINNSAPTLPLLRAVIEDQKPIALDPNGLLLEQLADADGDGVADSKWILLSADITSGKGKPIYAAIRVIDNGGMPNVNTGLRFDPNNPNATKVDGSSQLQINLMALAGRPPLPSWPVGTPYTTVEEQLLLSERDRYGVAAGLNDYENFVIWSYGQLAKPYTPFDISDELELRYRFLLNHEGIDTRLEGWGGEFRDTILSTPVTSGGKELDTWFKRAHFDPSILDMNDPKDPNYYAYRHIATTCSMDRIIAQNGSKMLNVNTASAQELYNVLQGIINPSWAAQIAVNLIDSRDSNDNDNVTSFDPAPPGGQIYYGFERPCIYISELDYNQVTITTGSPPVSTTYKSYAVELYKPYSEDAIPGAGLWQLTVDGNAIGIGPWPQGQDFYVVQNQDPNAKITVNSNAIVKDSGSLVFAGNSNIELQRRVTEPNGASKYITVDSKQVLPGLVSSGIHSLQRDGVRTSDIKNKHKCIRRLWSSNPNTSPTLGSANSYVDNSRPELVQAHPANRPFTNIGEIGMLFVKSAYSVGPNPIGPVDTEFTARLNLADSALPFQQIFNYLTVFDPAVYPWNDPNETRIKGRININTAPWFVIAQLPWVSDPTLPANDPNRYGLARAIVAYRDTVAIGFRNIGQLMNVAEMGYYSYDSIDLGGFPDLTPNDGDSAQRNFEERDIIFHRISNLVTVRSDVFTAYILVRIGADGPQKRVIAILDRSQVSSPADKVKIIALYPVPDPR